MNMYAILRRGGWRTLDDVERAAARSGRIGNEDMSDEVRWIRSYVVDEVDGWFGSVCIYEAINAGAIRRHASLAELPLSEIVPVTGLVVVRPDPQPVAA
jgi:hypothetical protein